MMTSKIIYASDDRGKDSLVKKGYAAGLDIQDIGIFKGSPVDYIDIFKQLAERVTSSEIAVDRVITNSMLSTSFI